MIQNSKLAAPGKSASVADTGTLVSAWFDASGYEEIQATITKDAGAGAPALTWEQATSAGGAGAKALGWGGGTFATDRIEVTNPVAGLDIAGGFRFVRATVTVTGGAGTLIGLTLLGLSPRYSS